jgi:four helix bundle protein
VTGDRKEPYAPFEKLEVFRRAYRVSLKIHKTSKKFPKDEQFFLADQLRRASKSVCANIVEGVAKQFHSKPEFKRFLLIAIGSSDEARMWVRYAYDLGYIEQSTWQEWRDEYQTISRMLHGLYKAQGKT